MKTIMNSLTFFTALGMSGLAHAHFGTVADEPLLHKTLHFAGREASPPSTCHDGTGACAGAVGAIVAVPVR